MDHRVKIIDKIVADNNQEGAHEQKTFSTFLYNGK